MPTYVFECPICGARKDKILLEKNKDSAPIYCEDTKCNKNGTSLGPSMRRIIVAKANFQGDIEPYFDENLTNDATKFGGGVCPSYDDRDHCPDGVFIKSKKHKRELMKRWGYEYQK